MSSHTVTARPAGVSPHRRGSLASRLVFVAVMLILCAMASADDRGARVVAQGAVASGQARMFSFDGDLRDLPRAEPWQEGDPELEILKVMGPTPVDLARGAAPQALMIPRQAWQASRGKAFDPPLLSFPGSPFTGVRPPDPVGDVGPNHYIHAVQGPLGKSEFTIYEKDGDVAVGPVEMEEIAAGSGLSCDGHGFGTPRVLYDRAADKWLMAEIAYNDATSVSSMCVYISQSGDPEGAWWVYEFTTGTKPDLAHYGVWPDAYYVTSSEGNPQPVYALERSQMLIGDPSPGFQTLTVPGFTAYAVQALTPADVDSAVLPPAGSPGIAVRHNDDEAHRPGSSNLDQDYIDIFEVVIDWGDPANSKVRDVGPIPISEFESKFYDYIATEAIPQPGTEQRLDPMRELVMHRLAYRRLAEVETLVGNFVTNVAVDPAVSVTAAVRWFELRRPLSPPDSPWSLYQEGTEGSAPGDNRWLGAVAMDQVGNIALGYSFTHASSVYPSLFYTGSTAGPPLGDMDQYEYVAGLGSSPQTGTEAWGYYGAMSVDPVDDCTFWFTGEYMDGDGEWATPVVAFSFDNPSAVNVTPDGSPLSPLEVCAGTAVLLTATPSGGSGLSHKWYKDDVVISGATGSTYSVSSTGIHAYNCEVTGPSCSAGVRDPDDTVITWQAAPAFAGLKWVTATSDSSCGLHLEWDPGTPSKAKAGLVYNVYRDTSSNPDAILAHRIATCVTSDSFDDTTVSAGIDYYYIVRAEDSAVGCSGPCNGGNQDSNVVVEHAVWSDPVDYDSIDEAVVAGWEHYVYEGDPDVHWRVEDYEDSDPAFKCKTQISKCDKVLVTPELRIGPTAELRFWHTFNFETAGQNEGADGGVLEIDDGTGWAQVPEASITQYPYSHGIYDDTNPLWIDPSNPLYPTRAWSGVGAWGMVRVDLSAYSRHTAHLRWRMGCNENTSCNDTGGDCEDWVIDDVVLDNRQDVGCTAAIDPLPFHTGRASQVWQEPSGLWARQVKLEWINPVQGWERTLICWSTSGFITDPDDCYDPDSVICNDTDHICSGTPTYAGDYGTFEHAVPTGDQIYFYSGFAGRWEADAGKYIYSAANSFMAYPSNTIGPPYGVNWGFHTGASALTPPGLGSLFALTNTKGIFSLGWGPDGGGWITDSSPLAMTAPAQARPPVINFTDHPVITDEGSGDEKAHYKVVFVGVSDGTVLAMDGDTGEELWTSDDFGIFTAAPAGVFTDLGGSFDLLLIGTRNAGADNCIVALDPYNTAPPDTNPAVWEWDNGGGIGIISGTATWVEDGGNYKLYFASRERDASHEGTLWCIDFTAAGASLCSGAWPLELGDIDGSPIVRNGFVYVGTNAGRVYKVNATSGAYGWSPTYYDTGDGAVKGYVSPDLGSNALYLATTNTVWRLLDDGNSATLGWSVATIPSPSVPLFAPNSDFVYVGGGNGRLYQVDVTGPTTTYTALGLAAATSSAVGSPALDVAYDMLYVGTEAGALYSLDVPF